MTEQQRGSRSDARDRNLSSILQQIKDDGPAGIDEGVQVGGDSPSYVRLGVAGSGAADLHRDTSQAPRSPTHGSVNSAQRHAWRRVLAVVILFGATAALAVLFGYLGTHIDSLTARSAASHPTEDARDGLQPLHASVRSLTERVDGLRRESQQAAQQVEERLAEAEQANNQQLRALHQRLEEVGGLDAKLGVLAARLDELTAQLNEEPTSLGAARLSGAHAEGPDSGEDTDARDGPVSDPSAATPLASVPLDGVTESPSDFPDGESPKQQMGVDSVTSEVQRTALISGEASALVERENEIPAVRAPETETRAESPQAGQPHLASSTPTAPADTESEMPIEPETEEESRAEPSETLEGRSRENLSSAPSPSGGLIPRAGNPEADARTRSQALVSDRVAPLVPALTQSKAPETRGMDQAPSLAPDEKKKANAKQWAINLIALSNEAKAEQLKRDYAAKGVEVELVEMRRSRARGKLFGLRIPGFSARQDAVAVSAEVKQRLGIKEVWIYAY